MVTNINAANSVFSIGEALALTAADTLNVLADGYLASQTSYGAVFRGIPGNTTFRSYECNVAGSIYSAKNLGLAIVDDFGALNLHVQSGGTVHGYTGVQLYSSSFIVNDGIITGGGSSDCSAIALNAFANFDLRNNELISCKEGVAVRFQSFAKGGHTIENSGTIEGYIAIWDQASSVESAQVVTNTGLIKGVLYMGNGNDQINTAAGEIRGPVYLQDGNDKYTSGVFADVVVGGLGNDTIYSGAGNDNLGGSVGADLLYGGLGRDIIYTGDLANDGARDTVFLRTLSDSSTNATGMDVIYGFITASEGAAGKTDVLDLSAIDANTKIAGNQAFSLLATAGSAFTGVAGQLRYARNDAAGTVNDSTLLYGDVNGDKVADFAVKFMGLETFRAADFVL